MQKAQAQDHSGDVLLIAGIDFSGNDLYADDLLREQVETRPNRRFMGIPGLTWWLWLHEWGSAGTFGERISGALRAGGESPAFLNPRILHTDVERLRRFYAGMGFRGADVSVWVDTLAGGEKADIIFRIERGTPTGLASVRYSFERPVDTALKERVIRESVLGTQGTRSSGPESFKLTGVRFTESKLQEERRRIFSLLRRHGYAAATPDSVRAVLTPAQSEAAALASAGTPAAAARRSPNRGRTAADVFDVEFQIDPGARYHFGEVQVVVNGPESGGAPAAPETVSLRSGNMRVELRGETVLDPDMLDRVVRVRTGTWYDERALTATKRALEATGVFTYTNIVVSPGKTAENLTAAQGGTPSVPVRIELHTRQRHQLGANTFVQQERGAILTAGDNQIGTGVSVSYENVDLFGGGENLRLETTGAVAVGAQADPLSSSRAEISAALTLPYLPGPAGRWGSAVGQYDSKTRLSLGLLTARNERLRLLIRGRGRARFQFELQHSRSVTSWLDVMDLTLSSPDTLRGFQEQFLDRVIGDENDLYVSDPVQRAQIISDYTHPQINDAVRYSLRLEDGGAAAGGAGTGRRGYRHELSVEAGGYVSSLLDRTVFTPGEAEGTLPGLPFLGADSSGNARMRYRPYARAQIDLRRFDPLSSSTLLAVRAMGGLALATGYSDLVPFDRRFYSGGATSVRGWRLRELGPGGVQLDEAAASGSNLTSLLGGNVKLEASLELRQRLAREVLKAGWWSVMFVDAGNVWFGPRSPGFRGYEPAVDQAADDESSTGHFQFDSFYRQLGVGAGIGLRADWRFLVARLDLAYRLYDPAAPGERFLPDNYERPVLHFGIGHTF